MTTLISSIKFLAGNIKENLDLKPSGNRLAGRSRIASPPKQDRRGSSVRRQDHPHNGNLGGIRDESFHINCVVGSRAAIIAGGQMEGTVHKMKELLVSLWADEGGITSVEYALLLAFVAAGIILGAEALSNAVEQEMFDAAQCNQQGSSGCPTL